jgi:hypothetical protein
MVLLTLDLFCPDHGYHRLFMAGEDELVRVSAEQLVRCAVHGGDFSVEEIPVDEFSALFASENGTAHKP